jgi:flagellar motor switch protein FliN/FliY
MRESTVVETQPEERLMRTLTRAAEQAFERHTSVKPQLQWVQQPPPAADAEDLSSLEWWEAQYEAAGDHCIWIGVAAPVAVEIGRLAQAVATAGSGEPGPPFPAQETVESLCEAFAKILSVESGKSVRFHGLKRLEAAPAPEVLYSTEVNLAQGPSAPILVGFKTATNATFRQLIEQLPPGGNSRNQNADSAGPLGLLLDLELPLAVRFGRVQMPLERVLDLRPGTVVELEGSPDDQVDLLVNGSVVARGEVVAVEGHYGVRILEILSRDCKIATVRPSNEI